LSMHARRSTYSDVAGVAVQGMSPEEINAYLEQQQLGGRG